ncbi:uncharacterized protein LOC131847751 [Achroia grisella]|uniref:uncharacterized protein LOC131847751 n=1 Tax=Achroia grisella TaxID=688607 RepID=UPI0027D27FC0|nr:uncharacterized protein LOC131847751 [Achroia grisella]
MTSKFLDQEERRARNALYEKKRRNEAADAMAELAEALECDPNISNADVLNKAINKIQNSAPGLSEDISHLNCINNNLMYQINKLQRKLKGRVCVEEDMHVNSDGLVMPHESHVDSAHGNPIDYSQTELLFDIPLQTQDWDYNTFQYKMFTKWIIFVTFIFQLNQEATSFRILAPQYVCPKLEDDVLEKPDNTVITLLSTTTEALNVQWTIRWKPLTAPTQRFTIMLWRTVRELEKKLNGPQIEPNVYFIDNNDLLRGVEYTFNVSEINTNGHKEVPKSFNIDNSQGDQKLTIEGKTDKFSVILLGSQVVYVDMEFIIDAQVTSCEMTQDYYFVWTVKSEVGENFNFSHIKGSKLVIPQNSLKAGFIYEASCELYKKSDHTFILQTSLEFKVHHRGIDVYLSLDAVVIAVNSAFNIEGIVINHDNYDNLSLQWMCLHEGESCDYFEYIDDNSIRFSSGFPNTGQYVVTFRVNVEQYSIIANATIIVIDSVLPVLQISPLPRLLNQGGTVSITATGSNVSPTCTLGLYFASEEFLNNTNSVINDTCEYCQHGEELTESLTVNSLEENFLNELTDFSNDTEWRQITVEMAAAAGRLRFVADCGCSLTYGCDRKGTVYAEVNFQLNESPKIGEVMVSPNSGTALETIYRISTTAAMDPEAPLRYSFFCCLSKNDSLLLGSYMESFAVETLLPYVEGGTTVWVEVCDSLGACSSSNELTIYLSPGTARTIPTLINDVRAHVSRCEMLMLQRVAVSAIETYNNADQKEALTYFTTALLEELKDMEENVCIIDNFSHFSELLHWLNNAGVDTTSLYTY